MPTRDLESWREGGGTPQLACNEASGSRLVHSKQIGSNAKRYSREIFVRSNGNFGHPIPYACKMQRLTVALRLTP